MRAKLVLVTAVVAAGIVVPGPSQGAGAPEPVHEEGISFGAPVRMPFTDPAQVGGPGEPSIKVDEAGTIYVAGVCCVARAAPAWYSKDDGATWTDLPSPGKAREWGFGAEGDFVIDDAGSVYFSDTWVPSIFLTKWSGRGDVWEYTDETVTVLPGVDDRPWLSYSNGAIYLYVNHVTHTQIWKSTDGGHTWMDAYNTIGAGQRFFPGNVAADRRTDDVYFFGRCAPGSSSLCTVSSHDAGETWSEAPAATSPRNGIAPFMVSVDVDRAGNVYGTWADINGSGCDVYLTVSSDKGATWQQYRVNQDEGCSTFPWVAAGDDGRVALTWYHNPSKAHQNSVPATSEWRVKAAVITGAASDAPVITHGTLDRVIHRGSLGRTLWDYQQIAVGPDGRFHISFVEDHLPGCNGNLSAHGGAAAYKNMCTDWVVQAGGPRIITHATDQTSIDDLTVAGGIGSVDVSGAATFGRAAPVTVVNDEDGTSSYDIRAGTIARTTARSDDLVFVLGIEGMLEAVQSPAEAEWTLDVGGATYSLRMRGTPRRFEVCRTGAPCQRVRGDFDLGGDRAVARVPLAALGLAPGGTVRPTAVDVRVAVETGTAAGTVFVGPDTGTGSGTFTVPEATVQISVLDGSGTEVASTPAGLSGDLSSFQAAVEGLAPGDYTAVVRACFADACHERSEAVTVG
ncbi:MAG TPA: sialidase family protein [Actinomycetota bacterium]